MKIGILQASSQKEKNSILYDCVRDVVQANHEVINFGIFPYEEEDYSYIETAFLIALLLESEAIDFVVTGCSSGQGMMLACNTYPHVMCGYIQSSADAYLFGRINHGNAVSFPLGLGFGWAAEISLKSALHALFDEPFGLGYPAQDSIRKQRDSNMLKDIKKIAVRPMLELIPLMDTEFLRKCINRNVVYDYLLKYGNDRKLMTLLEKYRL